MGTINTEVYLQSNVHHNKTHFSQVHSQKVLQQFVSVLFFSGVKDGYCGGFWPGSDSTACVAGSLFDC